MQLEGKLLSPTANTEEGRRRGGGKEVKPLLPRRGRGNKLKRISYRGGGKKKKDERKGEIHSSISSIRREEKKKTKGEVRVWGRKEEKAENKRLDSFKGERNEVLHVVRKEGGKKSFSRKGEAEVSASLEAGKNCKKKGAINRKRVGG